MRTVHDAGMKLIRAVTMSAAPEAFADWGEELLLIDAAVPGSGEAWDYASVRAKGLAGRKLAAGRRARSRQRRRRRGGRPARGAWTSPPASKVLRGVKDLAKIRDFVAAAKALAAKP